MIAILPGIARCPTRLRARLALFELTNGISDSGGVFVSFLFDRRSKLIAEFDQLELQLAGLRGSFGDFPDVSGLSVNVFEQWQ